MEKKEMAWKGAVCGADKFGAGRRKVKNGVQRSNNTCEGERKAKETLQEIAK